MSREQRGPSVVIEWSPGAVSTYDPVQRKRLNAGSLTELARNLSATEAVFAVSRRSCFIRTVRIPDVSKDEAVQALGLTIGQHVPVDSGDASFDLLFTQDVGAQGRTAVLAAMRSSALKQLHEQANEAGLRVLNVMPIALGSGLLAHEKNLAGCAVVSDSVEGLAIDVVLGGDVRYSRAVAPGLSPGGLEAELNRTFAAAQLPCVPTLAAGIGLGEAEYNTNETPLEALSRNWGRVGISIELPETVHNRTRRAKAARSRLAALLCISAVLLATLVYLDRSDKLLALDKQRADMANEVRRMEGSLDAVNSDLASEKAKQQTLERAFTPAQPLSDVVRALNNHVPERVWLTGISVERGNELILRGTALSSEDVAAYMDALSSEPRFRDVKLLFANNARIEQTPVVQFSISAFPVGNVPITERTSLRGAR